MGMIRTFGGPCGLALLAAGLLHGQADLATVTGVVTDAAKAVIPGVKITVRNTDTDNTHTIDTNQEGYFTVPGLPAGPYVLEAASGGFDTYRQTGIVLETGQSLRIDIQLVIGAVTKTVSVTADAAVINTEDGKIKGAVLTYTEIQDMPLNGRDFTDLALTVTGVTANAQGGAGSFGAVNGARADSTNFMVDGFSDRNSRGATADFRPNIDALQEFKMETSGYSAEYGKMAGGIVNMAIRSGTNSYHGALFEYFRNNFFDARDFFSPTNLDLHQNQFGGLIAGPLNLPHYKGRDRTFFMISEESYRIIWGENEQGVVPTLAKQEGNFAGDVSNTGAPITIKNPFNKNVAFPGNIIPVSMMNPVGVAVAKFYPAPNYVSPANNYQSFANHIDNWDSITSKFDERLSDKDTFSVNWGKRWERSNAPFAQDALGEFGNYVRDDREMGGLTYTHLFSPTLIFEARGGVARTSEREHILANGGFGLPNETFPTAAQLGIQGSTTNPMLQGFPLVTVTNYLALGFQNNQPVQFFVSDIQTGAKLTWIKGSHTIKFGGDIARTRFNQPYYNNSRGSMTANGVWTGNGTAANGDAFADLLLGLLNTSTNTTQTANNYMRQTQYGLFFNDDWKVTSHLTLNLGLRYELDMPATDAYDRMSNFIPSIGKIIASSVATVPNYNQLVSQAGLTNLFGVASSYGLPSSLVYPDYKCVAPRIGFAWRPLDTNKLVLRGGYGIFYTGNELNDVRLDLDDNFPFAITNTYNRVSTNVNALTINSPWPQALSTLGGTTTSYAYELHAPIGYLQSYNLTVEREIGKGIVFEGAYVGSKGTHLSRQYNLNQPFRTIPFYEQFGTSFPTLFPQLSTITAFDFSANSFYSAGQFTLRKRTSGGFFYSFNYTYSKSIDDASQFSGASTGGFAQALDPRNLGLERARSDWDRGHIVTAVFSYQLPVGRGKRFLSGANGLENGVLGGWQLAGNMIFETGQPFTIEDSSVNASIGESTRPNRIATGYDYTGTGKRGVDFPWYSPSDFVAVPSCASRTNCSPDVYGFLPFAPGNSGRNILDGPGKQNIDLSLMKNWYLNEDRRKRLQFRWEVFNIFNHANFLLPNRNFNETAGGYISSTAASGAGGPRIMQFALRYEY
jgi:outer membrane receptor protein involved in Fe transport